MPSRDPQKTYDLITDALRQAGQRGIIASGWGGQVSTQSESIHVLDHAPHDWLFPRVAAVVHHGGAGTTAAGLRAGKPTLVIPHLADQPYWGRRVHELGVGAKPIKRQKLTVEALADGIRQITDDAEMQRKAADLGAQIRSEDGVGNAVKLIEQLIRLIGVERRFEVVDAVADRPAQPFTQTGNSIALTAQLAAAFRAGEQQVTP